MKNKKKIDMLSVKLPDGFRERIDEKAKADYTSRSQVVIQALRKFLNIV